MYRCMYYDHCVYPAALSVVGGQYYSLTPVRYQSGCEVILPLTISASPWLLPAHVARSKHAWYG